MSVKGRASFLSLMLLITLLSGCTGSEDEDINSEKTGPDYDGGGLNDGVDNYDDGEISVEFYFDIERTSRNPLRGFYTNCLLYTSPSPRDRTRSRMPSSA